MKLGDRDLRLFPHGPDPLRDLIVKDLGLEIKHIAGGPCVIGDKIILTSDDLAEHFGEETRDEVERSARVAPKCLVQKAIICRSPRRTSPSLGRISGEALLKRELRDETARHYVGQWRTATWRRRRTRPTD